MPRKPSAADRRSHDGKRQHPNEWAARKHLADLRRQGAMHMSVYRCAICKAWHVGHHNPRGPRKKKRR